MTKRILNALSSAWRKLKRKKNPPEPAAVSEEKQLIIPQSLHSTLTLHLHPDLANMVEEYCWTTNYQDIRLMCFDGDYEKVLAYYHSSAMKKSEYINVFLNLGLPCASAGGYKILVEFIMNSYTPEIKNVSMSETNLENLLVSLDSNLNPSGPYQWNWGFAGACIGGYLDIVEYFVSSYKIYQDEQEEHEEKYCSKTYDGLDWNLGILCACAEGHMQLVTYLLSHIDHKLPNGFWVWSFIISACGTGNMEFVSFIMKKLSDDEEMISVWNIGLAIACFKDRHELIDLMISKGANWWNLGIACACFRGHLQIVNQMIKNGAKNLRLGLLIASEKSYLKVCDTLIKNGARVDVKINLYYVLSAAVECMIDMQNGIDLEQCIINLKPKLPPPEIMITLFDDSDKSHFDEIGDMVKSAFLDIDNVDNYMNEFQKYMMYSKKVGLPVFSFFH